MVLAFSGEKKSFLSFDFGCVSFGESKIRFMISKHMDTSFPKKQRIRKRIFLA